MKFIERKELNTLDIRTEEYWNRLRLYSLINKDVPSLNKIFHRAINSKTRVLDIIKTTSLKAQNIDNTKFFDLSIYNFIIENIPIFTFLKYASFGKGNTFQLRQSKFIDRDTSFFIRLPKEVASDMKIRKVYEKMQLKSIKNYREAYYSKNKKSREYAKLLLPIGIQNRAILSVSTKEILEITNSLLCSDLLIDNQLGDMFEKLINKDSNFKVDCTERNVIKEAFLYIKEIASQEQLLDENFINELSFDYVDDVVENLITNFELLINPLGSKSELEFDYNDQINIGQIIGKKNLGNIASSKGAKISGFFSLVDILNLLQHNYIVYVPLLNDYLDIDRELDRPNKKCFLLPEDLKANRELKKYYSKILLDTYSEIKSWRKESRKYMSEEISIEFTKYLLPMAHMTRFNWYLDVNDIFSIKDLNWEYKEELLKKFFQKDPLFKK